MKLGLTPLGEFVLIGVPLAVLYVLSAVFVAWVAAQKNRSVFGWFLNGMIFSPLLAMIALGAVPPLEPDDDHYEDRGDEDDDEDDDRRRRIRRRI